MPGWNVFPWTPNPFWAHQRSALVLGMSIAALAAWGCSDQSDGPDNSWAGSAGGSHADSGAGGIASIGGDAGTSGSSGLGAAGGSAGTAGGASGGEAGVTGEGGSATSPQFELTLVDSTPYSYTGQSEEQSVVQNQFGIFVVYRLNFDPSTTKTDWRLAWSQDGGKTFQTLYYESGVYTTTPTLETDQYGDVYLTKANYEDGNAYFYLFNCYQNFANPPEIITLPGGSAGKYASLYDPAHSMLYFANWTTLYRIYIPTRAVSSVTLLEAGPHAAGQYPHLTMSPDGGALFYGWTSVCVYAGCNSLYFSNQYIVSWDGGISWAVPTSMLGLPIAADDTGPGVLLTLGSDLSAALSGATWSNWMDSFFYKDNELHAMYTTPNGTRYVRMQWGGSYAMDDYQLQLQGQSEQIDTLGGFFAADSQPGSPLYALGSAYESGAQSYGLGAIESTDNGTSWKDLAYYDSGLNEIYALGGNRSVTSDGYIIGIFTDFADNGATNKIYFFKLKVD